MKRIFRAVFAVLLVTVAIAGAGYAWLTRPIPATHPTLATANLPPLIGVADFFMDRSAIWDFAVSHDGRFISYRATEGITPGLRIERLEGRQKIAFLKDIDHHFWQPGSARLNVITEGRLWRIDPEAPDRAAWADISPRGFQGWNIVRSATNPEARQLVVSADRNPAFVDLYTTNADGGDKALLIRNAGQTIAWAIDDAFTTIARLDRPNPDVTALMVPDGEGWREVLRAPISETLELAGLSPDGQVQLFSSVGRPHVALVQFDPATGQETVLAQDDQRDITDAVFLSPTGMGPDLAFVPSVPERVIPLTPRGDTAAKLIAALGPDSVVDTVTSAGPDGRFVLLTISRNAIGYEYHLMDLDAGTTRLIEPWPFSTRHRDALVPTTEVMIPARDGLILPSLLTRPKGVTGPVPLVIEVHGGPAMHEERRYNHFRQYLANRGYAVLVVNFRGSTGFGRAHQAAGFGAFGRGMQDDLVDAARWAVDQGIADPKAIAIMGASYGGYAAALAALRDADTFTAAVAEFPMLDLAYQSQFPPAAWGLGIGEWTRYFGDPADPAALAQMTAHSPVTHAADLAVPMLIHAGRWDGVTGFEQVEAFLAAAGPDAPMPRSTV